MMEAVMMEAVIVEVVMAELMREESERCGVEEGEWAGLSEYQLTDQRCGETYY